MKIVTVVGARPQFIKASAVSRVIRDDYAEKIEEVLVHTGLRAKRDAFLDLPKMWRKRQLIQKMRVASIGEIWRQLDKRMIIKPGIK